MRIFSYRNKHIMANTDPRAKVKVLLAQALFGSPDIILLDEPTNNLDLASVVWLENFLLDYEGTVLVVSHDRYFLNNICTHIVDIDYGKIRMYVGNYDFWYESSQLIQRLTKDQNKKAEQKIEELQTFIRRFSANKSKSRQATSRRKLLDKLTVEELPASSRRYPWVGFRANREPGKDRLFVTDLCKTVDGVPLLKNVSFIVGRDDKIALLGKNELAVTMDGGAHHLGHVHPTGDGVGRAGVAQGDMLRADAQGDGTRGGRRGAELLVQRGRDGDLRARDRHGIAVLSGFQPGVEEIHLGHADEAGHEQVGGVIEHLLRGADLLDKAVLHGAEPR